MENQSKLTWQVTGDETEIFYSQDSNATPVALVPRLVDQTDHAHMALVRLFSAAPDLLAALESLLQQVEYMGAPEGRPDMQAARAAITKAKGEA